MFSKKELVAVVEVDDPEWQATTFKKCLTGDQTWRDYLKMPENVKVSFRFIDPEPLNQNQTPPSSYFNFGDIFKKNKRRNMEQPSPIPETFNELNHRLSKLELKIHELGAHKSESEISSSRENNHTSRPNSFKYSRPQSPVVYTLNTQNLKYNKNADKNFETRCVETTQEKNPWVYTNKQTQYSIPKLAVMDTYLPKYVDKSTSRLVSSCPSPIIHPKVVHTENSLSKACDELASSDKPEKKSSQTSSLLHRISNFLQSVEKGCEIKKDKDCTFHTDRLRSGSSVDGRDFVTSSTDIKEETPTSSRHREMHPCRCCLALKEKKSTNVINKMKRKTKRNSRKLAPKVSKSRSISCPDLEDMSKILDEQAADIKELKRMMGQCLKRLDESVGGAQIHGESRKEKKMIVQSQKQEEKLRKLQENIRKKQEKILKEQEKRKRKEQKRLQKYVQYMRKDQEKQEELMRSEMIIKKQSLEHEPNKKVCGIPDQDSQSSVKIKEIKCPCKHINDCRCSVYKRMTEKAHRSKY